MDDCIFFGSCRHDGQDSVEEPFCPPLEDASSSEFPAEKNISWLTVLLTLRLGDRPPHPRDRKRPPRASQPFPKTAAEISLVSQPAHFLKSAKEMACLPAK